jgi:5-methylcytosine-specific restriction endonuclease McrA
MSIYSLSHLDDGVLLRDLAALVARDRATTAELLAHIAEVDTRKLYVPAAHPSMFSYCVHVLRLSEEAAFRRIHAARAARRFPAIFPALADGRLHLTAVILLAPHLTDDTIEELLAAATHRTKAEIEQWLAARFPRRDVPTLVEAIALTPGPAGPVSPGTVGSPAPEPVGQHALERVEAPAPRPKVAPLAPQRFALQVTVGQGTYEKLKHAQDLLGHELPSGDVAQVLDRALDALIGRLEKRKFAATSRPRREPRRTRGRRTIPADVKRAVWARDGGRCTYVSERGQRCPARSRLELDHIDPVARGGEATVAGMRLRCRAHNQYEAERTFGAGFMSGKRRAAVEARGQVAAHTAALNPASGSRGR